MKWHHSLPVVAFALLVPTTASAAANKEHLQLLAEIRMMQEQQQQLQVLIGSLQDTMKIVTTKLDEQSAATRKAMADQTLAVTNIGDNVRFLREKTDETNVRISTISQEIDSLRQAIASQPAPQAAVAVPTGAESPTGATGVPPTPAVSNPAAPVGVSPQRWFEGSNDDYTAGRYDLAITGFQGFIQHFPKGPQAAQAQFLIGQSYYLQSKWSEAQVAFQKAISDYPQESQVVGDSYYKLGMTFEQQKQVDNAKKAYEAVVKQYPTSFSASQAKQALDRLNRK